MHNLTVVFDLDGTLIDTAPDLILATNHALATHGFERVEAAAIRPFISFGTRRMIEEGLRQQSATVTPARLDQMFDDLIAFYSGNMTVESAPLPGLIDVLERLHGAGATLAICTNKREDMAVKLIEELGLSHYFKAITGRDTFPVCKPDPAHLLGAIEKAGGARERSVMVGDSTVDYETAKAAGIPIIGVTFGYSEVPIATLDCAAVISDYGAFLAALTAVAPS